MSTQRRSDDDRDREIRAHLEIETDQLIDQGVPPETAPIVAHRAFGNVTALRERLYEARRVVWLDQLRQDARCAARSLRRYPIAALVAIVSLAGGIGATTVTLMVRDMVFRRPPPLYTEPEQLSRVQVGSPERPIVPLGSPVPAALFAAWREELGPAIAAASAARIPAEARVDDRTEPVSVRAATPNLFPLLGIRPAAGRLFASAAETEAADAVILSYHVWSRLFDARMDAIGRVVWIDNRPHAVVGVLPPQFWFTEMDSPIWTPMRTPASRDETVDVIVRRPEGMTPALLDARLQSGLSAHAGQLPAGQRALRLKVSGVEGTPIGHQVAFILPYVLAAAVILTLLIACANVAILMIAQWTAREHELAIGASIGASRGRIVRTLLTESVLLAVIGGISGIGATLLLRAWIVARAGSDVGMFDLAIDPVLLLKAAAITFMTGLLAGIAPALYETRRLHVNPLRALASSDRVRQRWRHALVVLEITVTVALLVVTTALIDGYQQTRSADMGFSARPLLAVVVERPAGVTPAAVLEVLRGLPGVAAAAAATNLPYTGSGQQERAAVDAAGGNGVTVRRTEVTADFFASLGVPVRAGRAFTNHDRPSAGIAIVNETLGRQLFQERASIGQRVWVGSTAYEIVGVVADYADSPQNARTPQGKLFVPLAIDVPGPRWLHFVVRADGDPAALVASIRREVRGAAPGLRIANLYTFEQIIMVMGQEMLVGTAPLFPLIAVGTLLTAAGIYGVLAFAITRRSRELAVRIAIGATGRDVIGLVTAQTLRLVAIGTVLGTGLTFALARIVRAVGGAGTVFDPRGLVFLTPIVVLVGIGVLATWIPARRALKINPSILLRST